MRYILVLVRKDYSVHVELFFNKEIADRVLRESMQYGSYQSGSVTERDAFTP